MTILKKYYR